MARLPGDDAGAEAWAGAGRAGADSSAEGWERLPDPTTVAIGGATIPGLIAGGAGAVDSRGVWRAGGGDADADDADPEDCLPGGGSASRGAADRDADSPALDPAL